MAARCLLASRGIADPTPSAVVGALDEVEHRRLVAAFLTGLGEKK